MIARLTVSTQRTGAVYPIAERVEHGWQNGAEFYPDSDVTAVTPLIVQAASLSGDLDEIDSIVDRIKASREHEAGRITGPRPTATPASAEPSELRELIADARDLARTSRIMRHGTSSHQDMIDDLADALEKATRATPEPSDAQRDALARYDHSVSLGYVPTGHESNLAAALRAASAVQGENHADA